MIYKTVLLLAVSLLGFGLSAPAQDVHTPKPGSSERQELMDALRVPAEKDLGRKVIFKVDLLKVARGWAFARVSPIQPNGEPIDYSRTKYRKQMESGDFDPQAEALLHMEDGEWKVLEWRFGATDIESPLWPDKYRMPRSLVE